MDAVLGCKHPVVGIDVTVQLQDIDPSGLDNHLLVAIGNLRIHVVGFGHHTRVLEALGVVDRVESLRAGVVRMNHMKVVVFVRSLVARTAIVMVDRVIVIHMSADLAVDRRMELEVLRNLRHVENHRM